MKFGTKVWVLRGNPNRGPETGYGYGRNVKGVLIGAYHKQCLVRLEQDDPDGGTPHKAGESGWWASSQVTPR